MFNPQTGLIPLFVRATLHLLNSFTSIETFYENLRSIDLVDETRLRPTWDAYFMQLANLAAQRSNCSRCNTASAGGSGLSTCLCLHAEENALLEAGRERIGKGSILYCDTCPCLTCSVKIAQVGISEVVYSQAYSMDNKTADVLSEGGVKLRQFSPVSSTY
ncbi:Deoxycytidine monophosphate (dCMP) deaminase [Orbilia oligospora]|uniref:dCMP deaminase n=1 Tax=Orbilia oligospora TaxID=2813651 RepID=A0A7C8TV93_ORBOL|nr:Deoxycytidine monophosphate (dCMP) deaminase [Orbilia oligospora]